MKETGMLLALVAVLAAACDGDPDRDEGTPMMTIRVDSQGTDSINDLIVNSVTDPVSFAGVGVDITGLQEPVTLAAADFDGTYNGYGYDYTIHNIPQQGTAVVNVRLSHDGEVVAQGEVRLILRANTYQWVLSLTRALDPIGWSVIRGDTICKLPVPLDCVAVHRYPIREDIANYPEEALWLLIQHGTTKYGCPLDVVC